MKRITKISGRSGGFTLVELLTVMAVIALLIGLLVPALNTARKYAKDVRQRAQLHGIEAALEAFHGDYGDYPPSNLTGTSPVQTCGSQKLTEALLGLDLRGYDPTSNFDLTTTETKPLVYALQVAGATAAEESVSLARRKGPYLKTDENVGAYSLYHLFSVASGGQVTPLYAGGEAKTKKLAPVLCDTYKVKNITIPDTLYPDDRDRDKTVKAGTPILYYKAKITSKKFDRTQAADKEDNIYNWRDNGELIDLGLFTGPSATPKQDHHFGSAYQDNESPSNTGLELFYDKIRNPKAAVQWPYNPDTFVLISAGYDGVYGTEDDVTNFGGE